MFTFRLAAAAADAGVIIVLNVAILATTTAKLTLWWREFCSERFFFGECAILLCNTRSPA